MTSPIIETDIKEILTEFKQQFDRLEERLDKRFEQIDKRFDELQKDITTVRVEIAGVKGDVKLVDEKVNGLGKRLENQEFISRGVLIALIVAILGGFAKLFGLVGNP
jgi:predicted nuclease with TOPRIM domain